MKIDLGCGNKKGGFVGVDKDPKSQADYIVDMEKDKLPSSPFGFIRVMCILILYITAYS